MADLKSLLSEFPHEAVSWRAQSMTRDGDKAMALAYIDARDVMRRLDEVCGPEGWQDRYEVHGPRVICYLSLRVGDDWVTKADGAGDTDVEAEKGAISDAFKRAAVKWGIGRYLYDLPAPWVPCETYEKGGKHYWKAWRGNPWDFVGNKRPPAQKDSPSKNDKARETFGKLVAELRKVTRPDDLDRWWLDADVKEFRGQLPDDWRQNLADEFKAQKQAMIKTATIGAG